MSDLKRTKYGKPHEGPAATTDAAEAGRGETAARDTVAGGAERVAAEPPDELAAADDPGPAVPNGGEQPDEYSQIDFGELEPSVIYPDPFPVKRLRYWTPNGHNPDPQATPITIVVRQNVLEQVNRHVAQDRKRELGGFLLGNRCRCPNSKRFYVLIDLCCEARFTSGSPISLELGNETFQRLWDDMTSTHRGKDVIGWYHSHPKHGIFLSPDDVKVHESRFRQDWTVALVVNPNKNIGGFFRWHDGVLRPRSVADFYELRGVGGAADITSMPWANYQCFDSETGERTFPRRPGGAEQGVSAWWMRWAPSTLRKAAVVAGALVGAITLTVMLGRGDAVSTKTAEVSAELGQPETPRVEQHTQTARINQEAETVPVGQGTQTAQANQEAQPSVSPDNITNSQTQAGRPSEARTGQPTHESNDKERPAEQRTPRGGSPTTGDKAKANKKAATKVVRKPPQVKKPRVNPPTNNGANTEIFQPPANSRQ